jgi:hypothetical protein
MPGHALLEITGSATETLQAALEAFADPDVASGTREAPSKRDVVQAAERVKSDAAKGGCSETRAHAAAATLPPADNPFECHPVLPTATLRPTIA